MAIMTSKYFLTHYSNLIIIIFYCIYYIVHYLIGIIVCIIIVFSICYCYIKQ